MFYFSFPHHLTKNSFSCVFTSNPFKVIFAHKDMYLPHFSVLAVFVLGFQAFVADPQGTATTITALNGKAPLFPYSPEHLCHKSWGLHLPFSLPDVLLGFQSSRLNAFPFHYLHLFCSNRDMHFYQHESWFVPTPSFHPRAWTLTQEIWLMREQGNQSCRAKENKGSWGDCKDLLGIMREDWMVHRRLYSLAFKEHLSQGTRTSPD